MEVTDIKYGYDVTTLATKCGTLNSRHPETFIATVEHEGASFQIDLPASFLESIKAFAVLKGKELMEEFIKKQKPDAQS